MRQRIFDVRAALVRELSSRRRRLSRFDRCGSKFPPLLSPAPVAANVLDRPSQNARSRARCQTLPMGRGVRSSRRALTQADAPSPIVLSSLADQAPRSVPFFSLFFNDPDLQRVPHCAWDNPLATTPSFLSAPALIWKARIGHDPCTSITTIDVAVPAKAIVCAGPIWN